MIAKKQGGKRIFPGWWMAAACMGVLFVYAGSGFYSFGVLFRPLQEYFHAERTAISLAQSLFMLMVGLSGLLAGRLLQTYKAKHILLVGALIGASAFFLLSQTKTLWQLYLFYSLLGLGLGAGSTVLVANIIANWFVRRRGLAMGIAVTGIALGGLALIRLEEKLINATSLDWRGTYAILGLIVLAVDIPLALFLIKNSPKEIGTYPDGDPPPAENPAATSEASGTQTTSHSGMQPPQRSLSESLRSAPFWLMGMSVFLVNTALIGVMTHEIPFLRDMGISAAAAAGAFSFTAGIGAIGKMGFGFISDRLHVRYVTMFCIVLQAIGVLLLMKATSMTMVWVFVVFFGIAMGANATLQPLVAANIFGMASYGVIWGALSLFVYGAGIVGPTFTGWIYDSSNSYTLAFNIFIGFFAAGIIAIYLAWGLKPTSWRARRPIPFKEGELKHDRALLPAGDEKGLVGQEQVR